MTLQRRNLWFKAGIMAAALSFVFIVAAAFAAFPVYPLAVEASAQRSSGLFMDLVAGRMENSPYVPLITALGAVFFSLAGISLIHYYFEKTQSPEILYIGIFVISMAFECARVIIPLKTALDLSSLYIFLGSRALIFGRCLGLFSLFAAGICAAGFEVQKQRGIVFASVTVALIVALGVPIDGLSWDSTLNMLSAYSSMFLLMETGLLVLTVLSFLVAAFTKGTKEYIFAALGILMVYLGRNLLLNSDTWITPLPAFLLLSAGTWLISTQLHQVYLWM